MTPTFCPEYDEDLSALLDGELAAGRAEEVRAHVAACARCAARLAAFARVDSTLSRSASAQRMPAGLEARLRQRILDGEAGRAGGAPPRERVGRAPRRPRGWIPWAGAAAAACAGLALFVLLRPARETGGPAPGRIAEAPAPPTAAPEAAPPRVLAERAPEPTPPRVEEEAPPGPATPPDGELSDASEDELSLALELSQVGGEDVQQAVSDLDLIRHLDAVERLDALDSGNRG